MLRRTIVQSSYFGHVGTCLWKGGASIKLHSPEAPAQILDVWYILPDDGDLERGSTGGYDLLSWILPAFEVRLNGVSGISPHGRRMCCSFAFRRVVLAVYVSTITCRTAEPERVGFLAEKVCAGIAEEVFPVVD